MAYMMFFSLSLSLLLALLLNALLSGFSHVLVRLAAAPKPNSVFFSPQAHTRNLHSIIQYYAIYYSPFSLYSSLLLLFFYFKKEKKKIIRCEE
jgi:hypothetical protein